MVRFNLPTMQTNLGSERSTQIIGSLHAILKPFLLRRLKVDVATNLPPKKEYVLYAPLSIQQREAYDKVLEGSLRSYLIGKTPVKDTALVVKEVNGGNGTRALRSKGGRKGKKSYAVDGDDDEYFAMLEKGELDERGVREVERQRDVEELGREHQFKATGMFLDSTPCTNVLTIPLSQTGEQHEIAEYRDAITQSVLSPFPLRLAPGSGQPSAHLGRSIGQYEWQDDGT